MTRFELELWALNQGHELGGENVKKPNEIKGLHGFFVY